MELRLLHGVAQGETWFGHWGYHFGSGTYGVTRHVYEKALEVIQNVPLCLLNHHLTNLNREIPILLTKYQTLSNDPLITLRDLFLFMLDLHPRLPTENDIVTSRNHLISIDNANCRWSQKRIQMAIKVIIESLKRVEYRWISRQEVRDAARNYIGDTGLLDFVLKSLGNQIVGNYLVRRSLNPVKKVLEYCLEDISNLLPSHHELIPLQNPIRTNEHNNITRGQVMKDMMYLYKHILKDYKGVLGPIGILNQIGMASRVILDAKYFIKEYNKEDQGKLLSLGNLEEKLGMLCTIVVKGHQEKNRIPPFECIMVRKNATFSELYSEAERVFREIYRDMRDVVVVGSTTTMDVAATTEEVVGKKIMLEGRVGNNIVERGFGLDNYTNYENENVKNNKVVKCGGCDANEDDGERMVCCDICEVWQHTRCVGIPHNSHVPHIFLCNRCDQYTIPLASLP